MHTNDKSNIGLNISAIILCNFITKCIGIAKYWCAKYEGTKCEGAKCGNSKCEDTKCGA